MSQVTEFRLHGRESVRQVAPPMESPPPTPLDDLLRQARRLRFVDPTTERAFLTERVEGGLLRARVMLIAAMVAVVAGGGADAANLNSSSTFLRASLQLRAMVELACAGMLVSTWIPGHVRRAEWVNAPGVAVFVAFPLLNFWHFAAEFPQRQFLGLLMGNLIAILAIAAFAMPLRARLLAWIAAAVLVPGAWFFRVTVLADRPAEFRTLLSVLFVPAPMVVLMAWWREAGERTMFAQREHTRRLNTQLAAANAELARLNAEKNEFMAVAAHDLRAPLGAVRGLLQLVRDGKIADGERRREALGHALGETERMHALLENYLGAHALESGRLPVELARVDLGAAARELVSRFAGSAAVKRQTLTTDAPEGRVWVRADAALLAQVGGNFVSNALKFSPPGATVRVALLVAPEGGVARLAVTDEGPGIGAAERDRLFRKFERGSARPTAGESSTGLGLAVAKRLAEAMAGAVGCDSPVEGARGATFWVELPLDR